MSKGVPTYKLTPGYPCINWLLRIVFHPANPRLSGEKQLPVSRVLEKFQTMPIEFGVSSDKNKFTGFNIKRTSLPVLVNDTNCTSTWPPDSLFLRSFWFYFQESVGMGARK